MHEEKFNCLNLKGKNAFYLSKDYLPNLIKQLSSKHASKTPIYSFKSKNQKIKKWVYKYSRFFPPYHFFWYIHTLGGKKVLLPSSNLHSMGLDLETLSHMRLQAPLKSEYKFKRVSLEMDGLLIDAVLVGTEKTFLSDRWILFTNGNAEFYENKLVNKGFYQLLDQFEANALIFNYPGVGASKGSANRFLMRRSALACMAFLEDSQLGLGAKEIIGYGHSIGGGVQGEITLHHRFKKEINYAFIKSRTFCSFARVAAEISSPLSGFLVSLFGWNMKTAKSSKHLKYPEIILQSALVHFYIDLSQFLEKITHDGVIPQKSSLAYSMLKKKQNWSNKIFIGIFEGHNQNLVHPEQAYKALLKLWNQEKNCR